jgi:hypothetical protein
VSPALLNSALIVCRSEGASRFGGEPADMRNRVAWGFLLVLAGLVLLEAVPRAEPYWVARFRGEHCQLQAAMLTHAPLRNAHLWWADLQPADLDDADLTAADLRDADLRRARLLGARLARAQLMGTWLQQTDLRGADLTGALYDSRTHWPAGFDPVKHGAISIKWLWLPAPSTAATPAVRRLQPPLKHGAILTPK